MLFLLILLLWLLFLLSLCFITSFVLECCLVHSIWRCLFLSFWYHRAVRLCLRIVLRLGHCFDLRLSYSSLVWDVVRPKLRIRTQLRRALYLGTFPHLVPTALFACRE